MIDRLRVSVNLQHVETGDLALTLIAPDGTAVSLMTPQRRLGWDLLGTTFADTAAMILAETADPHPGSVQPATPLSVLHGKSTAGAWKLRVADWLADGIGGTLISWAIEIDAPVTTQNFTNWMAATSKTSFAEYAFGNQPTRISIAPEGGLYFWLDQPTGALDFMLQCQTSLDLEHWQAGALNGSLKYIQKFPNGRETLRYWLPTDFVEGRKFLRFKAMRE
jgi:subtilisin-like proprotein convertase family protein